MVAPDEDVLDGEGNILEKGLPGDFHRFMDADAPDLKLIPDAFGISLPTKPYRRTEPKHILKNRFSWGRICGKIKMPTYAKKKEGLIMTEKKKLPIGIEDFGEIRTEGFYYVDKTAMIAELLRSWGKVNLFTRPRRFGKSLNMSMLKHFFEYGCNRQLFEGLAIAKEQSLCDKYMGRFPVISITLKGISAMNYDTARAMLCSVIGNEALRFQFLRDSERLTDDEKGQYNRLVTMGEKDQPGFIMPQEVLVDSLRILSALLLRHYGQKTILLIDEYDVPLEKAQQSGYYAEMADLIRNLFGQAMKGNSSLYFAVLTGCLRVSKESIFTGLNNPQVMSISDVRFAESFGFVDEEVREILDYYELDDKYDLMKKWYDGYHFGDKEIYCPWDIINYCTELRANPRALPQAYWINTSGNDIIRRFIDRAAPGTRKELERLMSGESVTKKIKQELTYRELYANTENLWSVLYATGYLTRRGKSEDGMFQLAIPNLEIMEIFGEQIMEWFRDTSTKDTSKLDAFCKAFQTGDAESVEELFNAYLSKTISIRDTGVRKVKKENFYHGILLGLLSHQEDWYVRSNAESGDGYSDILVELEEKGIGIVIEIKYVESEDLLKGCQEALAQIEAKGYEAGLRQDGMGIVLKYGIACHRKKCRVRGGEG